MAGTLSIETIPELGEIEPGTPLAPLIASALERMDLHLTAQDVIVVAQKVVSKSEERFVDLRDVLPGARARDLATACGKDPVSLKLSLANPPQSCV